MKVDLSLLCDVVVNKDILLVYMEQIKLIKTNDVTATLLAIPLGKTVYCPNKVIKSEVVRTIASRLGKQKRGLFIISAMDDGVSITRR